MTIFQYLALAQDVAQEVTQDSMGQMDQASGQALWMTWWPLVSARWIHFASVFVLFGSSFFWFYMPREHSLAHPGQLTKTLAATTIMLRIAAPLAAISQAWLGHAAEGGAGLYGALMITVYAIHALATGAWVGGLPPLLFALVEQRGFDPYKARECTLDILSRFSLMAMVAVTLLVASGITNAGFRVAGSFGKLVYTDYGNALFTKVSVVSAMLALAYFNRFIAMPRLRRAALKGIAPITWLGRSVALELALGVLVVFVAAVLGITPPPQ
jgi:putative copper export protein